MDSLIVTREYKKFRTGALYGLLLFENIGKKNSGVLSEICDIDETVDIGVEPEFLPP